MARSGESWLVTFARGESWQEWPCLVSFVEACAAWQEGSGTYGRVQFGMDTDGHGNAGMAAFVPVSWGLSWFCKAWHLAGMER